MSSIIVYLHPSVQILRVSTTFLTLYSFLITPEGTFSKNPSNGVKRNPAVHREKLSVPYLCYFFTVKVPSSTDKTASIAATTLMSFAAAIVHKSKKLFLRLLRGYSSSMEQSLLVFVPPTSLSIKETLNKGKF